MAVFKAVFVSVCNPLVVGICFPYRVVFFRGTCGCHVLIWITFHADTCLPEAYFEYIGVTAFLMLLFNPVWLFDVGFQLSFSAVAAIVLLQPGLYGLLSVKNRLCVRHGGWLLFPLPPR